MKVSPSALHAATATALTGAIIAGCSSCFELGSNALIAFKNKEHGFDPKSADKFVMSHLKRLDELLDEREKLIALHKDNPAYSRAIAEGTILRSLRNAFVNEYGHFHADARGYSTFSNLFYLCNAITAAIGATAAGYAYRSVTAPKVTGTANILFIITGGFAMFSPLLSSVTGKIIRDKEYRSFIKEAGVNEEFDYSQFKANRLHLDDLSNSSPNTLMPAMPAVSRLALYTQSGELFQNQLDNEIAISRHLEKVALQSYLFGPMIGGTFLAQGILGTVGYYKYPIQPRKQLSSFYNGAIVGTTGASLGVAATAAALIADLWYEHRLRKEKRMPYQLIEERLKHIDEVEKQVLSL